jgi:hypothetical protein
MTIIGTLAAQYTWILLFSHFLHYMMRNFPVLILAAKFPNIFSDNCSDGAIPALTLIVGGNLVKGDN